MGFIDRAFKAAGSLLKAGHRLFISDEYRHSPLSGIISIEPQVGRIDPRNGILYGAKQQRVLIRD